MAYIGNAPAAGVISGDNIQDATIGTADLANSAVTAAKLASTAVTDKLGYTPVNKAGDTMTGSLAAPRLKGSEAVEHGNFGYWKSRDNSGGGEFALEYATNATLSDANIKFTVFSDGRIYPRAGVLFPSTQVASSDANTLDDYEEGTWSPGFLGLSGNPSVNYIERSGHYTKIGNLVRFHLSIQWNSYSGGAGTLAITLPFATSGSASWQGNFTCAYAAGINQNLKGVGYTDPGRSDFFLRVDSNNTGNCGAGDVASGGHLIFGGTFIVA